MKTMAKSLKSFLLALLIIPVAFVFSACGSNQLSTKAMCDTTGVYTESSPSELEQVMGEEEITSFANANGFRITSTMTASIEGATIRYDVNAIIKANEFAMEVASQATNSSKTTMELYYKDLTLYINNDGEKEKRGLNNEDLVQLLPMLTLNPINLQDMTQFLDLAKTNGANVTRVEGTNRFKVDLSSCMPTEMSDIGFDGELSVYVNFDADNNLVGIKMVGSFSMEIIVTIPFNIEISLSAFNGDISYPNFNSYV